jgi:hypothetical protein
MKDNQFNLETQRDAIVRLVEVIGFDGHTLWAAEILSGFPDAIKKRYVEKHTSDGSLKGTIYIDDEPVGSVVGVHGLRVLLALARDLGVEYESAMGRGELARNITYALRRHLGMGP